MSTVLRNRIKGHRRVRAGDLVPHELNFRLHPELQKAALEALYHEIGFARSLLAYELPDGRLKLIDGHLRRDLDPDMEVDVEILDVNDDEARTLLLSIDPLAALAETDAHIHERLCQVTQTDSEALGALWQTASQASEAVQSFLDATATPAVAAQFLILIKCRDEPHQVELLQKLQSEGLSCRALLS
jgi:hypothetical protein